MLHLPLTATYAMKPQLRIMLTTVIASYAGLAMLNLHLTAQLRQDAALRQTETTIVRVRDEPVIPAHVENIARKFLAGYSMSEVEMAALSGYIEHHTAEWNAWADTQDATPAGKPF